METPEATSPSTPLGRALAAHAYPAVLRRRPALVRLLHRATAAATLRAWYVHRALRPLVAALPRPFRLLDAGCGGGDLLRPLAERHPPGTAAFVGVDRSASGVGLVRAYAERVGLPHLTAACTDLADFTPDAPFDLVTCITVLQYVPDDAALVRRMAGWLRPGGRLLLYVPVRDRRVLPGFERLRARLAGGPLYDAVQKRAHRYAPEDVRRLVRAAGLVIETEEQAYGPAGRLAFELLALALAAAGRGGVAGALGALAGVLTAPLVLGLMAADYAGQVRDGNGLLVVARRPAG